MDKIELIKAFKQGGTGNCVSIATIKAGIEIFGLNNVFQHKWDNNICYIIMRDGAEIEIPKPVYESCFKLSKFEVLDNDEIYKYAVLCFSAMAKRAQIEENDNIPNMTFEMAAASLNDGEFYLEGPHWLGLRHNIRSIGRKFIWQYKGVIGASRKHCFFASQGYEDAYGSVNMIGPTERRFCKWFRVTDESIH